MVILVFPEQSYYFRCRKPTVKVRLGSINLNGGKIFHINVEKDIIIHKDFDPVTKRNDIALIRTPESIVFDCKMICK